MNAKQWWKIFWCSVRVRRRKETKTLNDMAAYGTGVLFVPHDGSDPHHIPIKDFQQKEITPWPNSLTNRSLDQSQNMMMCKEH